MLKIAYNWIWSFKCSINKIENQQHYLIFKEKHNNKLIAYENLIQHSECALDFDALGSLINSVSMIYFNVDQWKGSTCTCKHFSKKYFCAHIIVVAVFLKLVEIPVQCKNVNIGNKKKPGRPSKATLGLPFTSQPNVV